MNNSDAVSHPVVISQVIVNFARHQGVDLETCLLGTGIMQQQLSDPEALVTREQEMRLIENLMLALPQYPALGFELGMQYSVSTFGIWGFALRTSRNLREAAQRALRYLPLSTAYCAFGVIDSAQDFGLSADPSGIPQHLRQLLLERDLATGINLMRELGLAGIAVRRLEFQGPAPLHAARIEQLCGVQPAYQCRKNAIVLRREDADKPLPMYDPHLVRLLEDQCRDQLEKRQISGITGQVRSQLLGELGLVSSLEDVAKKLALSPRSLRRKLDQEGTNFRAVMEQERKMLAQQLLQSTHMKLDEMALHLGYADTASFTRAFRRWFGQSPGQFRNECAASNTS